MAIIPETPDAPARPTSHVPDTGGTNFYEADPALTDLLALYLPDDLYARDVARVLDRTVVYAQEVAHDPHQAAVQARQAATALYNTTCAVLLLWEGTRLAARQGDARRFLLARLLLEHRLQPRDPLATGGTDRDRSLARQLLSEKPVPVETATALLRPEE
jgi:hypothetical protein